MGLLLALACVGLAASLLVDGWPLMSWGARLLLLGIMLVVASCGLFDFQHQRGRA